MWLIELAGCSGKCVIGQRAVRLLKSVIKRHIFNRKTSVYNALLHFFIFHPSEFLTPCVENIGLLKLLKVALCTLSVSVRC